MTFEYPEEVVYRRAAENRKMAAEIRALSELNAGLRAALETIQELDDVNALAWVIARDALAKGT